MVVRIAKRTAVQQEKVHAAVGKLGIRAGRLTRVADDTLWVDTGWFVPDRGIPLARLRRLDFIANEKETGRVIMWGTGIGAGIGVMVGMTLDEPDCQSGCEDYPGAATATVLLGTTGALVGTVVAMFVPPRANWVKVDIAR